MAILTLNRPVTITKEVRPICVYTGTDLFVGEFGRVAGWGSLFEGLYSMSLKYISFFFANHTKKFKNLIKKLVVLHFQNYIHVSASLRIQKSLKK